MSQLSKAIIGESKHMIAEGSIEIEVRGSGNSNFQLILSSKVRDDFPIMQS